MVIDESYDINMICVEVEWVETGEKGVVFERKRKDFFRE